MKLIPAKPSLDVRDLELVVALAAAGSTVRAASSLHLTQSAVSRGLLLAEEKLGAQLFERTARGLRPTPAGERLVRGAGPLLAQLAELERDARAPVPKPTRVRLVCECYTAYRWLPSTLLQLQKRLSDLEVTIAFEHTRAPVRALERRDVDIALLTTSEVSKGLGEIPLFADEIVFVVGRDHPLARRPTISREDLLGATWLTSTQTPEPEVSWFMTRVFGRKRPHVATIRFPLTEAIVDAARANLGVAIMSEWIVMPYVGGGDLVVKRFRGRPLRRPWRLAYRDGLEDSARHLAAVLGGASPRL